MACELHFEVLGSGSAMNYELGQSNFRLRYGNKQVIFDLDATTLNTMGKRDFPGEVGSITDVVISHVHGDHVNGLENLGFVSYNVFGREGDQRPTIHVATEAQLEALKRAFHDKMKDQQYADNSPRQVDFDHYFGSSVGGRVRVEGMPEMCFHLTLHVQGMECYGLSVPSHGLWVSGDSREVKDFPEGTVLGFRDAAGPGSGARVHADLDLGGRSPREKAKTVLYGVGGNWRDIAHKAEALGFFGLALPGEVYIFDGNGNVKRRGRPFIHQMVSLQ